MTSCRKFFLDFETYSSVDITKYGSFKYIDSDDFEILLIACAFDDEPIQVYTWEEFTMIFDDGVFFDEHTVKVAHNCAFERGCLNKVLNRYTEPSQWQDTMIMASMNGLPLKLEAVGAALNLQNQKLKEGEDLIRYFSKPAKNGGRHLPEDAPEKWERFKEYCKRDVEVERTLYYMLNNYPVTPTERKVFELDARINERGVLVDHDLAAAAVAIDTEFKDAHSREMFALTGLDNPNSTTQLKRWLKDNGIETETLDKNIVAELTESTASETVKKVLTLRTQLSKTSTTKYDTLLKAENKDGRVRGILMYYGAGRTGRWAGRIFQPQNLPQNHLTNIGDVRELLRMRDLEMLEMTFDNVPDILSQLIRTALIAKPGHTFLIADYSAIEARVIAYLAGEQWRMDVFKNGGDIYCSSASQMFKVPVEKHGINGHLRQKGKVAELACGYGGGVGALKAFGADKMGLTDEEMQDIVNSWRQASPKIPKFWRSIEDAAKCALNHKGRIAEYWAAYGDDAENLHIHLVCFNSAGTADHGAFMLMKIPNDTKIFFCTVVGIVGGLIAELMGGWTNDVIALFVFMGIDLITGIAVATVFKKSNKSESGAYNSKAGFIGLCRKFAIVLVIIVAHFADVLLEVDFIRSAAIIAYISNELVSIIENVGLMGVPIPSKLKQAIEILRDKTDGTDKSDDEINIPCGDGKTSFVIEDTEDTEETEDN